MEFGFEIAVFAVKAFDFSIGIIQNHPQCFKHTANSGFATAYTTGDANAQQGIMLSP